MGARSGRPEVSASTSAAVVVCFLVASASGFCPHACTCDAALRTAACPGSADLDIIPITLNPNIESLVLAGNRIKTVDASIQFYRKLQRADFSDNRFVFKCAKKNRLIPLSSLSIPAPQDKCPSRLEAELAEAATESDTRLE